MADDGKDPGDRYPDSEGPFAGPNNTFPLTDEGRIKNAWARIHQGPTEANHSAAEIAEIKRKILAEAKKQGITLEEHDDDGGRTLVEADTTERRAVLMPVELRALPDGGEEPSRGIGGYAAVFNSESRLIPRMMGGSFVEHVNPTFFEEARSADWPGAQGSGVLCRWNHHDQYLLGTTAARTCELTVDKTGLFYEVRSVPRCRDDVLEMVGRQDIRQSSFTFFDAQDDWDYRGGVTHRTLISGGVVDVAPVSALAGYQDTTVSLRSLAAFKDVPPEDVFDLARHHELRKLFIRTDQAPAPADPPPTVHIENIHNHDTEGRTVADTEPAPPPPATPDPPPAPAEPEGMSWQEARLRLMALRPNDPVGTLDRQ